ncbi:DExH-box ATP-dependent RNA helicase DExH6-like isoform X2 [Salvia splendens]|uniref:DExH-box ATP-dependent RNA helicase DExH6-like isoform X2 n=1 Tax=Salvia splendens TaxID=180675 RepID=UPI001C280032|nr:DExH-box ATP-dependent RNA helicase DExH6-like isoform X2 [Salvia splendens]
MGPPGSSGKEAGRKRQKGRVPPNNMKVAEATRIRIAEILEKFRSSDDEVYKFEENLTNQERAAVHVMCRKAGFMSKSHGKGQDRRICIYKRKREVSSMKGRENIASFRFSGESQAALQELFSCYPPNDVDMSGNKLGVSKGKSDSGVSRDDFFCRPTTNPSEIASKIQTLASRIEKEMSLKQIAQNRSKLPIASFRDAITSSVESNQVVLVCGETGCGKTTQVPQFLLDHAWSKGETCKVVCTQPRRISATSVAERIASERGESIGDSVGYKDEIHERDRFSDFMLAIIRDMLPSHPHLRLVLMSATIDADRFSKYFGGCPVIRVPGFTYPVKSYYLEDVLALVRSSEHNHVKCTSGDVAVKDSPLTEECRVSLDEAIELASSNDDFDPLLELISSQGDSRVFNYQHSKTGVTPLMVSAEQGRVSYVCTLLSFGVDCDLRSNAGKTALDYAEQGNQGDVAEIIKKHMGKAFTQSDKEQDLLDKYLSHVDPELIDCLLIEQLLRRICNDSTDGAVLVFLPGWDDINRTREKLLSSPYFKDPSKFLVIALHSMVPLVEQKKVFKRPPPGCRKIVLSTNIAETSVTIDDVVYVIDSGRMKEKSYDPYNNVSTLHSSWISKASAKQREGRAGRCQAGICYHLYSKFRASSLPEFQVPEIKRMPIEELCLQVKLMDPSCKIEEFLQKTLDPPVYETIQNAITVLQDIGALSLEEQLTELGQKLGALPVHPLTSKMLFFAILLNCLDPALTLACASDCKDPFILPMLPNERKKAQVARLELASLYGGNGDQLAIIAAFDCWKMAKQRGDEAKFCSQYFVSAATMKLISSMRKKLEGELLRHGFIPEDASRCSLNARDPGILHAVVFSGLYPMVGRVIPQGNRSLVETASGNKVRLHQFSTNGKLSSKKFSIPPLIMFDEITRGDGGIHIRNCCVLGSLPLMLLATDIVVAPTEEDADEGDESDADEPDADNDSDEDDKAEPHSSSKPNSEKILSAPENVVKVVVDRWLPFQLMALDVAQIYCLRERLSSAILFKVTKPRDVLPEHLGASLYAIACILSYDGMSGISLPPEPVDTLTTMVSVADISHGRRVPINRPAKSYLKSLLYPDHPYPNQSHTSHHHTSHLQKQVSKSAANWSAPQGTSTAKGNYSKRQRGNGNGFR